MLLLISINLVNLGTVWLRTNQNALHFRTERVLLKLTWYVHGTNLLTTNKIYCANLNLCEQSFVWHFCSDKSNHSSRRPSHEQLEDSVWLASLKKSDAGALAVASWSASIVIQFALAIAVVITIVVLEQPLFGLLWFGKVAVLDPSLFFFRPKVD